MTRREARDSLRRMRGYDRQFWSELCDFLDRQGWRAAGYARASECIAVELGRTLRHGQRLAAAAEIFAETAQAGPAGQAEYFTERAARELARLPTADLRRECYAEAAADGDTSAAAVRELVDARLEEIEGPTDGMSDDSHEANRQARSLHPAARSGCDWGARVVRKAEAIRPFHAKLGPRAVAADAAMDQYLAAVKG